MATSASLDAVIGQPQRLESLDAFRGLTIAVMVFVIAVAAADYRHLPQEMSWFGSLPVSTWNHAEVGWDRFHDAKIAEGLTESQVLQLPEARLRNIGLTITDLVAPFFVFIVGVAIPLSRNRRGSMWWKHVLSRTGMLILMGVVYISLILGLSWWWGILQAIGIAYFMGAASTRLSFRGKLIALGGVLLFQMLMSAFVPWWLHFGDSAKPFFTIAQLDGSWAKPLTIHCRPWVSISYGAMTMIGVLVGEALPGRIPQAIIRRGMLTGTIAMVVGYAIHRYGYESGMTGLCFNKPDVTASYALFSAGFGAIVFIAMYIIIDLYSVKKWARPLTTFGVNALLAYFLQIIMRLGFRALKIEPLFSGEPNAITRQWAGLVSSTGWQAFWLDKTGWNGVIWGIIWTACLWIIVHECNRRNIYWKL